MWHMVEDTTHSNRRRGHREIDNLRQPEGLPYYAYQKEDMAGENEEILKWVRDKYGAEIDWDGIRELIAFVQESERGRIAKMLCDGCAFRVENCRRHFESDKKEGEIA